MKTLRIRRQRGGIAIMFGLTLVVLLAAGGLVIDLGHLYVLKSELQNGADSAALAGAEEIDMTGAGINKAAAKALAFSQQNNFNFSSALVLSNSNISFASSPDGPWVTVGEAAAAPSGKSFIRVDTGTKDVPTYLMAVAGIATVGTSAIAVAGRFVVDITPLGVCAIDPLNRLGARPLLGIPPVEQELLEYGYRRGTTYDMLQLKNIAGSSDPMLINPVDSPPTACGASHSSSTFTAPFLCQGNSAVAHNGTTVYANTGVSAGPVEKALNSRFNDFGGSPCVPATAPPDRNVLEYKFDTTVDWMSPAQSAQSQVIDPLTLQPSLVPQSSSMQGVLWTYSRPLRANGTAGSYTAGTAFDTSDWDDLYNAGLTATASYPAGNPASPYAQTSGAYFLAPSTGTPVPNRRLLNIAILDCTIPAGSGSCQQVPLLGVGRFFMQRKAALSGSDKGLWVEFAGLISPVPNSEIKLYR